MSRKINYYAYIIPSVIVLIIAGLVVFNNKLMKQLNEIEAQSAEAKPVPVVAYRKVEDVGRFEIPQIDPDNDPLAPVVPLARTLKEHTDMQQKKVNSEASSPKNIYEFGQDSDIKLQ